jgi:excisionase family DNA binding protein
MGEQQQPPATNGRILLSIEDIMRLTPLKKDKIHELIATGVLPHVPIGRVRYVRRATLDRYLETHEISGVAMVESDLHQRGG